MSSTCVGKYLLWNGLWFTGLREDDSIVHCDCFALRSQNTFFTQCLLLCSVGKLLVAHVRTSWFLWHWSPHGVQWSLVLQSHVDVCWQGTILRFVSLPLRTLRWTPDLWMGRAASRSCCIGDRPIWPSLPESNMLKCVSYEDCFAILCFFWLGTRTPSRTVTTFKVFISCNNILVESVPR